MTKCYHCIHTNAEKYEKEFKKKTDPYIHYKAAFALGIGLFVLTTLKLLIELFQAITNIAK